MSACLLGTEAELLKDLLWRYTAGLIPCRFVPAQLEFYKMEMLNMFIVVTDYSRFDICGRLRLLQILKDYDRDGFK